MSPAASEPFEPIHINQLCMRCPRPGDETAISMLVTSDITRWMASWPDPFTISSARNLIGAARSKGFDCNAMCCVIVFRNAIIGWVEVSRGEHDPRTGNLSYWIGTKHQGNGFATSVVSSIIPEAFSFLHVDSIRAGAQIANKYSISVMKKVGMNYLEMKTIFSKTRKQNEKCEFYSIDRHQSKYSVEK